MRRIAVIGMLLSVMLGVTVGMAVAQVPVEPPVPAAYAQLIEAGKLTQRSEALTKASGSEPTLKQRRTALSDRDVIAALRLLRQWLNDPNRALDAGSFDGNILSGLTAMRSLARALAVEQYVLLADGKISDALENMRDGLRLSYAVKSNSMIVWLTGTAMEAIALRHMSRHLDQLSRRDCDRLLALAQEWMAAPDSAPAMLDAERAEMQKNVEHQKQDFLAEPLGHRTVSVDPQQTETEKKTAAEVGALSKADIEKLWSIVSDRIDALFAHEKAEILKPLWEREEKPAPPLAEDASLADRCFAGIGGLYHSTLEIIEELRGKQQAKARLLGCHALIHAYRWEHDRLPVSLAELKAGDFAIDPFTGKEFLYTLVGTDKKSYTLMSSGPPLRDDDGNIKPGERVPFAVTK